MPSNQDKPAGYQHELELWTESEIIDPLVHAAKYGPDQVLAETKQAVIKVIRAKVLESYRNGQKAGPRKTYKH